MKIEQILTTILITVLFMFTGCATKTPVAGIKNFSWSDTPRSEMLKQYKKMSNCCRSANEIEFDQFPDKYVWSFDINHNSKAIEFDTGLSPIKAYRLPNSKLAYKLSVISHTLRDKGTHCFANCSYMFIPIILFLDRELKPLYTFLPGDLRPHDPNRKPKKQYGYSHRAEIEANNKAKYFVIYTTPSLVKNSAEFSFTRNAAVYSENGTAITGSPFGKITISIEKIMPVIKI